MKLPKLIDFQDGEPMAYADGDDPSPVYNIEEYMKGRPYIFINSYENGYVYTIDFYQKGQRVNRLVHIVPANSEKTEYDSEDNQTVSIKYIEDVFGINFQKLAEPYEVLLTLWND